MRSDTCFDGLHFSFELTRWRSLSNKALSSSANIIGVYFSQITKHVFVSRSFVCTVWMLCGSLNNLVYNVRAPWCNQYFFWSAINNSSRSHWRSWRCLGENINLLSEHIISVSSCDWSLTHVGSYFSLNTRRTSGSSLPLTGCGPGLSLCVWKLQVAWAPEEPDWKWEPTCVYIQRSFHYYWKIMSGFLCFLCLF